MLTDDDLTGALRLAFDDATGGLEPAAGLTAAVHRRHRAARRRSTALRVAVPAAAACAGGLAVLGGGTSPSAHGPAERHSTIAASGESTSRATTTTVAYTLRMMPRAGHAFDCLSPGALAAAHNSATWRAADGACTVIVVDTDAALPPDASPIELAGAPGLFGSSDAADQSRTVYSRNPDGGWSALTVAADTPDQALRGFYVPGS